MYQFNKENHIHTLGGKPLMGTSTIVGVIAKPLTWWASGLAVEKLGWKNPKTSKKEVVEESLQKGYEMVKGLSLEEYGKLLGEAYKAHSVKLKDSAQAGTDLHAELEDFVKGRMGKIEVREYDEKIKPFIEWTDKNVKKFLWSEAHCYSERLWVGGISDCGAELNDGTVIIIDFKSSKEAYTSQFIQIAGYDIEIAENGLISEDGKYSMKLEKPVSAYGIVAFGAKDPYPVILRNVEDLKKGFESAVILHKLVNINEN